MALRCPTCGSKDLWLPRRKKSRFDLFVEQFGYKRFDCRGCWRRPILKVDKKKKYTDPPVAAPAEVAPEISSPEINVEEAPAIPIPIPAIVTPPELTIIGPTMLIQGEMHTRESIRVYGRLEGALNATGCRVVIEQDATVAASLRAADVVVRGRLEGDTVASGSITVCRDGRLIGEARTARLVVEDGAFVKGKNETGAELKSQTPSDAGKPIARVTTPVESVKSGRR